MRILRIRNQYAKVMLFWRQIAQIYTILKVKIIINNFFKEKYHE